MKHARLEEMVRGWFVGNFHPSALRTSEFEVAIRCYKSGETEPSHVYKVAVELTAIISGEVRMLGRKWSAGDIITSEPGEATTFEPLTDAMTVVVKTPSIGGDKYPAS